MLDWLLVNLYIYRFVRVILTLSMTFCLEAFASIQAAWTLLFPCLDYLDWFLEISTV